MTEEQRLRLRAVKTFAQLISFLRDELDWPIDQGHDEEDLTFDWSDDLGLKDEERIGIREIKQLRPLETGQPWGIFFVNFEKKHLPIVILRRILNALVLKKRASANRAQQAAWQQHDLLFISAYGQENERQLTFAHFSEPTSDFDPSKATLRVLGWDDDDTSLKLDYVADTLKAKLTWPSDTADLKDWRQRWSEAFELRHREVIDTAADLALRLADLAKRIRNRMLLVLPRESENGELRKLLKGFQAALIHDLNEARFADMYAQTITYGLFSAAVSRTVPGAGTAVHQGNVVDMVPVTNPFLREMLSSFLKAGGRRGKLDFDELGIQEVVDLLNDPKTHMDAVLRDFGNRTRGEDPVIHFYEEFLKAYDRKLKVQRGVFYTPQPVVSYIVRSVHELMQTEFGLADGLADTTTWGEMLRRHPGLKLPPLTDDPNEARTISANEPFVQILDPATGTATFLVEVIDVIYRTLAAKWKQQSLTDAQQRVAWNEYVPKHLLPRLHAFELMMAPYAIAHMKIGLKLAETGYRFGTDERARIYLTNALEPWLKQLPLIGFEALAHEAAAVNEVKRHKRFTVVIGNPPYANYSANLSPQARRIVDKYRTFRGVPIRERNQLQFERNIQDDFVKFISIAQDIVRASGVGIVGYITNGTMLASTSLRGLRENLAREFSRLAELNLHGGGNEIIAGAERDENVFEIVQSVAVHVYVRAKSGGSPDVMYADMLGRRADKYATLASQSVATTEWRTVHPDRDNCGFTPQDDDAQGDMRRLDSVFGKFGAGIKTSRDAVVIGFDDSSLLETVRRFDATLVDGKAAHRHICSLLYRPFDIRRIFYHEDAVASRSLPTMKHVVAGPNIGLVCSSTWTTSDRFSVGISRLMVEMKTGTHDRGTTFFPLYRYEGLLGGKEEQVPNLSLEFVKEWCAATKTQFIPVGKGDGAKTTGPEDMLSWLYGLFYSPEYRRRNRAALSQRFPIVLLSEKLELVRALGVIGSELIALHLLESPRLDRPTTEFIGGSHPVVEKISWSRDTVWLDKAQTTGFQGVREDVWNFHIGGYQVCEKWLKDRKGRTLSKDDIAHYHKVVVALSETIRLMAEIDRVIDAHGGWPGAFQATAKV